MAETRRGVVLRLSADGAEQVKTALRALGKDGEESLRKLERSAKPVPGHLKLVDTASQGAQRSMEGLAARSGAVGRSLTALGPAGLAAAAGIGAIALGIGSALRIAREATREFDELAKRIRDLGIDSNVFQGLSFGAIEKGIGQDRLNDALRTFNIRSGQAALGTGELVEKLKLLDPELLKNIQAATTFDARLRLIADALGKTEEGAERARLAALAFGEGNIRVGQLFVDGAAGIDTFIARARELGIVVDRSVLEKAEEMENRLGVAAHVVDINLKQAFIDLVPVIVWAAERISDVARAINAVVDATRDIGDMVLTSTLENALAQADRNLDAINQKIDQARARTDAQSGIAGFFGLDTREEEVGRLEAERAELHRQRNEILARWAELNAGPATGTGAGAPPPTLPNAEADRIRKVIEALGFQAAQLGRTAAEQAAYNALAQAGIDENHAMAPAVMGAAAALYEKQEAAKAAAEALKDANKRLEDMRQLSANLLKGFLSDLQQGKSLVDALGNAISNVGNRLLDSGINMLFASLFPTGATGNPLNLLPFGPGRAGGGSVSPGTVYPVGEKGIELFAPGVSGSIIPNHALGAGRPGAMQITVHVEGVGDADLLRRVDAGTRAAAAQAVADYDRNMPSRVAEIAANPRQAF